MAKRSFVEVTLRKKGTDHPVKLDIDECRNVGRVTKRLMKSGMSMSDAKKQAAETLTNSKGL